jgi:hypothetical protein
MTQASRREADHSLKTASPDVYGPTADHIVAAVSTRVHQPTSLGRAAAGPWGSPAAWGSAWLAASCTSRSGTPVSRAAVMKA